MRKFSLCILFVGILLCCFGKSSKSIIPDAPNPPRLVNDFAGVMTSAQISDMEQRLVAFNDSTSNVICVVTVNDLGNYSAAQFAYEIGDQWGVRSKDKRNGVVILIKPNTGHGDGEVYISVGYDLEGAIPDAIAKRIIENKMIPELQDGDYHAAIDSALAYVLPLACGEISAERLEKDDDLGAISAIIIIIIIFVIYLLFNQNKGNNNPNNNGGGRGVYVGPYFGGFGHHDTDFGGNGGFGGFGGFGGGGAGGRF